MKRILIAEDEPLIAADLEDCVVTAGLQPVGPVASVEAGRALVGQVDGAIVNYILRGERADDLIRDLAQLGVPFVIASASGQVVLTSAGARMLHCPKPYRSEDVLQALLSLK